MSRSRYQSELKGGSTSGKRDSPHHVIAGKIAEIGDGCVLLGFSSTPIRLTDALADGFQPGQHVTISVMLIDGELIAQGIEVAPR